MSNIPVSTSADVGIRIHPVDRLREDDGVGFSGAKATSTVIILCYRPIDLCTLRYDLQSAFAQSGRTRRRAALVFASRSRCADGSADPGLDHCPQVEAEVRAECDGDADGVVECQGKGYL